MSPQRYNQKPEEKPAEKPQRPHLLLCRSLPAVLNVAGVAEFTGWGEPDVKILIRDKVIPVIGGDKVPVNGRRWVSTARLLSLCADERFLERCVLAIHQHWAHRNRKAI
jgi:hypothetical protein